MECTVCRRTNDECKIRVIKGMALCPKHLTQHYRNGMFLDKTIYDGNEYIIHDNHAEIVLRDKYCRSVATALIDLEDVERCKQYKWHIRKGRNTPYVIASLPENKKIHLHRFILNYDGKDDVDHLDGNGLNNRKSNLKVKTHSANMVNQSLDRKGLKKVPSGRYQAAITKDYKTIYLGTFDTKKEALQARLDAEERLFE